MDIALIIFTLPLVFFAWRGYSQGFLHAFAPLVSWLLAYPAAIFATRPLAHLLAAYTPITGLLGYFVAGATVFLLVSSLVSRLIRYWGDRLPGGDFSYWVSKISGLALGGLAGAILGLLLVYAIGLAQAPREEFPKSNKLQASVENNQQKRLTQKGHEQKIQAQEASNYTNTQRAPGVPALAELTQARTSFIEAKARQLMGAVAATAMKITTADTSNEQMAKAFAEQPLEMLSHVQAVHQEGKLTALMADPQLQAMMSAGKRAELLRTPEFVELMRDSHMQALLEESNLNSRRGREAAADKMIAGWQRANQLKNDPRVIAILSDPEIQQQLQQSNKLALLLNPKLSLLTELIFAPAESAASVDSGGRYQIISGPNPAAPSAHEGEKPNQPSSAAPKLIYRWQDAEGRVHYSDKPQPDQ